MKKHFISFLIVAAALTALLPACSAKKEKKENVAFAKDQGDYTVEFEPGATTLELEETDPATVAAIVERYHVQDTRKTA